jgi:NAD(P)H-dependent flavin oxidoreductase YrpB (nitropropane dioxygenase family)
MDIVADARLTLAVADAGGFGFLGGGYGDEAWLRRELADLAGAARERKLPFGVGFITWSLARNPDLLDIALEQGASAIWLSFGDRCRSRRRSRRRVRSWCAKCRRRRWRELASMRGPTSSLRRARRLAVTVSVEAR